MAEETKRAPDHSKEEKGIVNYRAMESCNLCSNFLPPNSCEKVEGNISPEAVCDRFNLIETTKKYFDKGFYEKEYQKSE